MNKYITATILAAVSAGHVGAQLTKPVPKLVVSITIDQLSSDCLESFMPYYNSNGFKKLLSKGTVYDNAQYSFSPVDRASAIASIFTGATPRYNGITGARWLDKSTMMPVDCVDDSDYEGIFTRDKSSPANMTATTMNDELKVATDGKAIVYSIAMERDAAVLGGGHAADGVFWVDRANKCWCSSKFYFKKAPSWMDAYNISNVTDVSKGDINADVTRLALHCVNSTGMGNDATPDMLSITYDAKPPTDKGNNNRRLQDKYIRLDREIETLINRLETKVGQGNVLFVVSSTGCRDAEEADYEKFRLPTGTFYINRTANLLNMYLGAVYGSDKYVDGCYGNQIYLNIKQIELKRINMSEILSRSQSFLMQNAGVSNAFTSRDLLLSAQNTDERTRNWFNSSRCGDIVVKVTPGWKLLNEDTKQQYLSRESVVSFPVIFYGTGIVAKRVGTPVTIEHIAPTIARAIRIRAPNACSAEPLY